MKANSSYLQKPAEVDRKWYVIDAAGKPLGRVAATVASILRGKHLPTFTPHADCGDHVIIVNAAKAILNCKNKEYEFKFYKGSVNGIVRRIHTLHPFLY